LYKDNSPIFEQVLNIKAEHRWGITATPFINDESLYNILRFCTGVNLRNQRCANIPRIQDAIMKIFIKNTKLNTKKELNLPPVTIEDIYINLSHTEKVLLDSEKHKCSSTLSLRMLLCDIQLQFGSDQQQTMTPGQLIAVVLERYKSEYETKLKEKEKLIADMKMLIDAKKTLALKKQKFIDQAEFDRRILTFKSSIAKKTDDVMHYEKAYSYFKENIVKIGNIVKNQQSGEPEMKESDDNCAICLNEYTKPISYFKKCGHFFCKTCEIEWRQANCSGSIIGMTSTINCPMCRTPHAPADINNIDNVIDISSSSKCHDILNLVKRPESESNRFIVFTQFAKLIDNLAALFGRNDVIAMKYGIFKNFQNKDSVKVIILSSEENASGIDMSFIDTVVIFEPFESGCYNRAIEQQLIGRCDRISQKKPVRVFRYICKDTIEEEIYKKIAE